MNLHSESIEFSKFDMKRNIKLPKKISPELSEEIGIHIGDGSLNKYKNYLYSLRGHKKDDLEYYQKYIKFLYKKVYNLEIKIREWRDVVGFQIGSKAIGKFKSEIIGLPLGKKENIKIPDIIFESNFLLMSCLRGIFDTDGCLNFEYKNKKYPYYPRIFISNTSKILFKQIRSVLTKKLKFNLSSWVIKRNKNNWNDLYRICIRGGENLNKWFNIIGSNNPKHKNKYKIWVKNGHLPR